ncbi:MAG: hypothetical protein ACTHMS_03265 [Jatrophihabitans sp.]|uniref:hypothetical protein n=1 Tax=Jatrophihabitans sp. TaxID=1932789 RepID=UPI003F7FDBFC
MTRRRFHSAAPASPAWTRRRMLALLVAAALVAVALLAGLTIAIIDAATGSPRHASPTNATAEPKGAATAPVRAPAGRADTRDALAAGVMPRVDEAAAHPAPVTLADPGAPLLIPTATAAGPAGVPTGYPHTPAGALAQLAAIDQTALNAASLDAARAVVTAWAVQGGPTASSWSVLAALAQLLTDAGGSHTAGRLAIVLTPVMGLIKGTVGADFVVPCVDFELDVTITQTARGATADCQRMDWHPEPAVPAGGRWMLAAGPEPATPPSVWPDTDLAVAVGYRDLRPEQ